MVIIIGFDATKLSHIPITSEEAGRLVSAPVVRTADRARKPVLIADGLFDYFLCVFILSPFSAARQDSVYSHDQGRVQAMEVRSILCLPVVHKGRVRAVVYLENNRVEGAFTDRRIQLLESIMSQVSISVDNAQLYENLKRTNTAYERFLPRLFLRELGKNSVTDVKLGDCISKHMTVLFMDIRGFTQLSQNMTPEESFAFINEFLSRMAPCISDAGGFIDKFIGDAVMALFPRRPEDALQAAQNMVLVLETFNEQREKASVGRINIGIGIHAGNLMLGTIGHAERMEGTVISDTVNTVESLSLSHYLSC